MVQCPKRWAVLFAVGWTCVTSRRFGLFYPGWADTAISAVYECKLTHASIHRAYSGSATLLILIHQIKYRRRDQKMVEARWGASHSNPRNQVRCRLTSPRHDQKWYGSPRVVKPAFSRGNDSSITFYGKSHGAKVFGTLQRNEGFKVQALKICWRESGRPRVLWI